MGVLSVAGGGGVEGALDVDLGGAFLITRGVGVDGSGTGTSFATGAASALGFVGFVMA